MPFPVLIRYDKGYRGQTDQYRKDFENVGNNAPYDSRHIVGRGYDDPNGYQSWYHNQVNENTGRRSPSCERNDNPPLRTARREEKPVSEPAGPYESITGKGRTGKPTENTDTEAPCPNPGAKPFPKTAEPKARATRDRNNIS